MASIMAVMNLATLPRTALTTFLHQEHHATMADLIQGIDTSTARGTDNAPFMDIGYILAGHRSQSHPLSHYDRSSSFRRHISHSSSSHHSSSHHPSANGCSHYPSYCDTKSHSCTPCHTSHFSDGCHSIPAAPTTQYKDLSPGRSSNAEDP